MRIDYIIIQAGGKGTRLKHLTANKPKGIVPVNNLPMIFHLMNRYKDKKFIIIADYKHEVMEKYLEVFSPADYLIVNATGMGTCAGISQALRFIPEDKPFMLIWSDLILGSKFSFEGIKGNTVGISVDFTCRWSYKNGIFEETPSSEHGVAGCFFFNDRAVIKDIPQSGEFVRWLQQQNMDFDTVKLIGTKEVGTILAYKSTLEKNVCRPFNSIEEVDGKIVKKGITPQREKLAIDEKNWYRELIIRGYKRIPKIFSFEPLTMEKVDGINIFKANLTESEKKIVLKNFVDALIELHHIGESAVDYYALKNNYYTKTIDRIAKVRDMIPFADQREITINGRTVKNVFFYKDKFKLLIEEILYDTKFTLIHGDCTFSNSLINKDLQIKFIDPRGYFGNVKIYGDEYYNWAKLYYSAVGNYDQFNNKKFLLDISNSEVILSIESSGFEHLEDYFFSLIPNCDKQKIKLLHAIIWLSLTTYAWEDYDSICGAFYNGLIYLNDFLN